MLGTSNTELPLLVAACLAVLACDLGKADRSIDEVAVTCMHASFGTPLQCLS